MRLVFVAAAWLVGLWLGRVLGVPSLYGLPAAVGLALAALALRRTRVALVLMLGAAISLAIWRYGASVPRIDDTQLAWYNDQGAVTVLGTVTGEPEPNGSRWQVIIAAREIWHAHGYAPVQGAFLATTPAVPVPHDGDTILLRGELITPPVLDEFSYKDYLARQGIYSLMRTPEVQDLQPATGWSLGRALSVLRRHAEDTINALVPEPEASLLDGILLGRDAAIPEKVMDAFRVTGTAHIIAISGYNIAIIVGLLTQLLGRAVGKRRAIFGVIPIVALYTVLVGADPPVVRAAIMGCLSLIALQLGRRTDALNALMLSAVAMTAFQPQTLWDVGFQLSFAATLGLILYVKPLNDRLERLLPSRARGALAGSLFAWLSEGLVVTVAAQILTLPLTLYYFRNLSPFGLLANLLILPAQPYVMIWGGSALVLALLWQPLGVPLAWGAWLFLTYTIRTVEIIAGLPGARVALTGLPVAAVIAYYAAIGAGTLSWPRIKNSAARTGRRLVGALRPWRLAFGLAIVTALVWAAALQMPDGRLHADFLDVVEGDAILIRTPGGRTALIDGGTDPATLLNEVGKRLPFWQRSMDLVVLTHPHADHAGGLIGVLERYNVKTFLEARTGEGPEYKACMAAVAAGGTDLIEAEPGQRLLLDEDTVLEVLYPSATTKCGSINDCSMVLRLTMGRASFLLAGDVESTGQILLLNQRPIPPSLVLKVPHHGGEDALFDGFIASAAPEIAIIQAGPAGSADPSPETLQRLQDVGARVFQTRRQGSVEIVTDGERYWVKQ